MRLRVIYFFGLIALVVWLNILKNKYSAGIFDFRCGQNIYYGIECDYVTVQYPAYEVGFLSSTSYLILYIKIR